MAPGLDGLISELTETLDKIEAWVKDTSSVEFLLDATAEFDKVIDVVKVLRGSADAKVKATVRAKPQFLSDGRTVRMTQEPKRTVRASGRMLIRSRIADKALAMGQGEAVAAIEHAITLTEETYISASTLPKWGALQGLGFTSWDEVADTQQKEKGVEIVGSTETTQRSEDQAPT